MTTKFNLGNCIEFYVTNECNLTCSNCNRYNNYDFRGHYYWKDSSREITEWAKRIDASLITIIGGEPSLHPGLQDWVEGLAHLWPHRPVMIQTNGLKPASEVQWWDSATKKYPNIGYGVAIHSPKMKGKLSKIWEGHFDAWMFSDCALVDKGEHFTVHNSNPQLAFNACGMRHSHTVLNGRLYKCPMVAILPEFQKQYKVLMPAQQQSLLLGYQSLGHDCSDKDLEKFVSDRDTPINQCSICPETHKTSQITFDLKRKTRLHN